MTTPALRPLLALLVAAPLACAPPPPEPPPRRAPPPTTRLVHLDADLAVTAAAPDRARVSGEARWRVVLGEEGSIGLDAVEMDVQRLSVTSATGAPVPATWEATDARLTVTPRAAPGASLTVAVRYQAEPARGVTVGEGGAMWTTFHTWRWLPASRDPSQRATLRLTVTAPDHPEGVVIATGDGPGSPGPDVASQLPHPSYLWGFYVGPAEPTTDTTALPLTLWAPDAAHPGLAVARDRTIAAWRRWRGDGAPWPRDPSEGRAPYTLVFVPGRVAQELAGMAFIGAGYLDTLTRDPTEDWLLVHELAHEVWGNRVTCATWGDFWLNEAVVVWWVARDKALRGDQAGYAREVRLWEERVARALARGDDPRIARPGATSDTAGGSIVYHGGALLLHDLTAAVGEERLLGALHGAMRDALAQGSLPLSADALLNRLALPPDARRAVEARLLDAGSRHQLPRLPPRAAHGLTDG